MNGIKVYRIGLSSAAVLFGAALASPAYAVLEATPFAFYKVERDDNVFRHRDSAEAAAQSTTNDPEMADTLQIYGVGMDASYTVSNQKFFVDGRINKTRFSHFDFLDFDGSDINGGVEWKVGSNLNGDLTLGRTRNLRDFADFSGGVQRSIETATTGSAGANLAILSDYEISGRVGTSRIRNSLATSRDADLDEDSVTIGAAYKGRTGISLGVEGVFLSGEYIERSPIEGYDQRTYQVVATWTPSPVSSFEGAIGSTERDNDAPAQADFSGATGSLSMTYNFSPKTYGMLSVQRNVSSVDEQNENFVVVNGGSVFLAWNPSALLKTSFSLLRQNEDYRGQVPGMMAREDDLLSMTLSADYSVGRYVVLTPSIAYEDRTSNQDFQEYDDWRYGLELRLQYPIR